MFKRLMILLLILNSGFVFAKKVKFAVNMTGQTISLNGVHVSGDFQSEAGFASDWDSKSTVMTKEGNTDIYSVEVNIPAFRKYEYKYVNGDLFYEVEFVPEKSRVGYDFNDSRWIFIDSLDTGVTLLPVLLFGGNAPAGKKMVKFRVDMQSQGYVDSKGVHVAGNFQGWNTTNTYMYSFGNKVHEYIAYVDSVNNEYRFLNGNTPAKYETVSGVCVNAGNRNITVTSDTILPEVCFASCTDCVASVFEEAKAGSFAILFPNPSHGNTILKINKLGGPFTVCVKDPTGRIINVYCNVKNDPLTINTIELDPGIYLIDISNLNNLHTTLKLVVE